MPNLPYKTHRRAVPVTLIVSPCVRGRLAPARRAAPVAWCSP